MIIKMLKERKVLLNSQNYIVNRWHWFVISTSIAITLMGFIVMVGWHLNVTTITQIFSKFPPIHYNAALCFVALGVAGIGLAANSRLVMMCGGIISALMGTLVIIEYITNTSFGIDTFFVIPPVSSNDIGRMSLATSFSFFLVGSSLVVLSIRQHSYAVLGLMNSIVISLALTSLVGYAFKINYQLDFTLGPQMAVHSALGFFVLGSALFGHAWLHTKREVDGLPAWSAYIGIALLPALSVDATSVFFSEQTWRLLLLQISFATVGILLITFGLRALTTAKVTYKGFLMIAIPLVPLLIFAGLVVQVKYQSESSEKLALKTSKLNNATQTLLILVTEAESAVRGYSVTRNANFLISYDHSMKLLTPAINEISRLTTDNPLQIANAKSIKETMIAKISYLSDTIDIIDQGDKKQFDDRIKLGQGSILMKRLKDEIETFLEKETINANVRRSKLDASWQKLSRLLVTVTVSAILLAGIMILSFSGGIGRRLKQLRENADRLANGEELKPIQIGHDEIAELDLVFHKMAELLKIKRMKDDNATDAKHSEALLKTGALQSAIFNSANFSSIATDSNGVIQIFNVGAERMLGYSAYEVLNKITPAEISDRQELVLRAQSLSIEFKANISLGFEALVFKASRGIEDIYELTYIRKDGSRFPAVVSVTALRDVSGNIIGYLLIGTDNTARKLAEEALLKTDALQSAIFNSANFSSIATDAKGVIQIFNVGAERMLGYPAVEVLNKITPADISDPKELIARAITLSSEHKVEISPGFEALVFKASRGIEDIYELTYIRKDGSRFPAVVSVTALRDPNEVIIGFLLIGTDISARKLAEDQLDSFFNLSLDMMCVWSEDGYFKRVNPAFTQTLGWNNEDFLARPFIEFVHPDERENTIREVEKQILGGKKILNLENAYIHKDGTWRTLSWSSVPYANGLMFAIARDITEQRLSRLAIIEARADSEKANQAKSEFLSVMSHEIRTPLNGVIGMVDVLHQSSLKGYQVEIVETIRSSAYSLLGIIEDILDFSKIEAGKLEIEHAPMSIEKELETVCSMLDNMAAKKNVELTLFTDPEIPETLLGDSKRLHQIVINLTSNAIKFSSEQDHLGKVCVQARLIGREQDHVTVEIRVGDNGIGIDKATQKRLFKAFTQADASTTRRFGGTGLGLTIVRNLVELMGGTIDVHSKLGKGSDFSVRLHLAVANAPSKDISDQSIVSGLNCLVVGQPEGIGDYLAAYLEYGGANVERVSNLSKVNLHQDKSPKSGLWIWIIDTNNTRPLPDELSEFANPKTNQDIHLVLIHIQRGKRREPRWGKSKNVIEVDGNCLTRQNLLVAVAVAAGRMSKAPSKLLGKNKSSFYAPVRDLALEQGRLILVVEDNATNQKVILHQLALIGYSADVADNGVEALQRWRSGEYALILTDLNMPKMDGYELTSAIRAEENGNNKTIIIALTANALKGEAKRCQDMGMNDYISKPVLLEKLKGMLDLWLPSNSVPNLHSSLNQKISVDLNVLRELIGSDPKLNGEFLQSFYSTAGQITTDLTSAYHAENYEQVSACAHKLKSSARSVGALVLGDLCEEIEQAHKLEKIKKLDMLIVCFEDEMLKVNEFLIEFLAVNQ